MVRPDYILQIRESEYHKATRDGEYMSSHRLTIFRKCPALFRKYETGEIQDADTPTLLFGRAVHALTLEGYREFMLRFAVTDGIINPKTGEPYGRSTKAYREWAGKITTPIISQKDAEMMLSMQAVILEHDKASELLSAGFPESTVRNTLCGVPAQCRIDWYDPERNIIVDLKTCANVDRFAKDALDLGYIHQMAFYSALVEESRPDKELPECWLIATEKSEPYRCAVYNVTRLSLARAREENEAAFAELAQCRATGVYPTRYEHFGYL